MMIEFAHSSAFRLFFALTLTLGILISTVGASVSHFPTNVEAAEQAHHAEFAHQTDDHGHSHEDSDLDESRVDHTHDHNPADHSHETPHLATDRYSIGRDVAQTQFIDVPKSMVPGIFVRLERPPKPISLI